MENNIGLILSEGCGFKIALEESLLLGYIKYSKPISKDAKAVLPVGIVVMVGHTHSCSLCRYDS